MGWFGLEYDNCMVQRYAVAFESLGNFVKLACLDRDFIFAIGKAYMLSLTLYKSGWNWTYIRMYKH